MNIRFLSRRMKSALLLLAPLFLSLSPAHALNMGLYSAADNSVAGTIDFSAVPSSAPYHSAGQYLRIDYPEAANKQIRIYTNNTSWTGPDDTDRAGLISNDTGKHVIPLYWTEFASPQPGGVKFVSESSWKKMKDVNNKDFQTNPGPAIVQQPDKVSYIYFGTKVPTDNPPTGDYQTRFVVEVISDAPDLRQPVILQSVCKKVLSGQPAKITVILRDDVEVKSAKIYYRMQGQPSFSNKAMDLERSPANPQEWVAQAALTVPPGVLEYYYEASDGVNTVLSGSSAAPHNADVVKEFAPIAIQVSPQGLASAAGSQCSEVNRAPLLSFQPGSVQANIQIQAQRLQSQVQPQWKGFSPVSAYEFSPEGLKFNRPVTLQLPYDDANSDGVVDGTAIDAQNLKVFWHDGIEWRNLGGTTDPASKTVTASISHFSKYALFPAGAPTDDQVRPLENIITPNGDGINDFAQFGISGNFTIKIFDIQGRKIRQLDNVNSWDGRDNDGDVVESGVYVYQVKGLTLVSGTLAVER